MPHTERIRLALRAQYFLDTWTAYLKVAGYPKFRHHLPREALDILDILIEGLLALIVIHRDYIDGVAPLLPWTNSTKSCEHTFGATQNIVKDFTFLDFIYMIAKLAIKLREAVFYVKMSDPKARASGYAHTYFDHTDVDPILLASFPSDDNFSSIAEVAAQEADSLSALVGTNANQVHHIKDLPQHVPPPVSLPPILAWYEEESDSGSENSYHSDCDIESDSGSLNDDEGVLVAEIQSLIQRNHTDAPISRQNAVDERMEGLTKVALTLITKEAMRVYKFAESETGNEDAEQILADEYQYIHSLRDKLAGKARRLCLPDISSPHPPATLITPSHRQLDLELLVELRE
ncbi:hypothetical protein EST38_g13133 [Candolleomyces aberdarensis]|uniref:Uncharacterized protein n=1 Tax=Candolleomyces aberdarensis TaxID=2316362 RepID=A0A4V1Q1T6_9AGAR|nr:hypothetical protein EST38_g13133 [Candolleomyces aberdarensis]